LVVWDGPEPKLIGPQPSEDTWELLRYVLKKRDVTTAEAAKALRKQVNNVSTRLKRMTDEGLVLRKEVSAPSGGLEFRYLSIG
jgi:predicted transcriptional regulator